MVAQSSVLEVAGNGSLHNCSFGTQLTGLVELMLSTSVLRTDSEGAEYIDTDGFVADSDLAAMQNWLSVTAPNIVLAQARQDGIQIRHDSGTWRFDNAEGDVRRRQDGFSAGMGGAELRDLTFRRMPEREALPDLSIFKHFDLDRSVPPGALDVEVSRIYGAGEAVIYFGGDDIPEVSVGQTTMKRPVRFLVTSYAETFFDRLRSAYRGFDTNAEKRRVATDVLYRTANKLFWKGSAASDLWGILNHPYMDTAVSGVSISASSTPAEINAEVSRWAFYAQETSKQVFASNACLMSPVLWRYLSTTRIGDNNDTTILEFLQKACPHIKTWGSVWELGDSSNGGPSGYQGMLFYRDDNHGINPVITLPPTALPVQSFGITDRTIMVMGLGDAYQKSVGNQVLVWYPVS